MKKQLFTAFVIAGLALYLVQAVLARVPQSSQIETVQQQSQNVELVSQIGDAANDVAISGTLACISAGSQLTLLNVSDPAHPSIIGQTDLPVNNVADVALTKNYVYAVAGDAGLRVVDISTPLSPTEVGSCHAPGEVAFNVVVMGSYAYVSDYNRDTGGGLAIIDISDPTQPNEVGFYHTRCANTLDVAVAGNYAYVLTYGDLRIVDISNPTNPVKISSCDMPDEVGAVALEVQGNYAYVAARGAGLRVVDISTLAAPVEVGFYDTPGWAADVTVAGNYAYVADSNAGLRVVDVSNPAAPVEVGFYDTPGSAGDVTVEGNYVYVATGDGGLVILWFAPSTTTDIPVAGGSLSSLADDTTYTFPAGAFTDTVVITHTARFPGNAPSPGHLIGIDHIFDVTAVYSSTRQPAELVPGRVYTVTVHYTDAQRGTAITDTLGLYWWDGNAWSQQGITSSVNITDNLVTAQVDHPSLFAVLGETETRRVYLPLVLR